MYWPLQELLQFLFREAKIHNAIVFFDECEVLFETRENRSNASLALMLTEVIILLMHAWCVMMCSY